MHDKQAMARVRRALAIGDRAGARAAVRELTATLGFWRGFYALMLVGLKQLRGEPFRHLAAATEDKERLSRKQIAGAVLLYQVVTRLADKQVAFELVRRVSTEAGVLFMSEVFGDLNPAKLSTEETKAKLNGVDQRFFNAEGSLTLVGDRAATFAVSRCRFVDLLKQVNASELGPIFCEVDRSFFVPQLTPLRLSRANTLATTQKPCDFRFDW